MILFKKREKFSSYFIYLCISFFLIFSIGGLFLRFHPQFEAKKKHAEWLRSMMAYDEVLGWRHVPNSKAWSESSEYKVQYTINSKGLRDKDYSYNKEMGRFRIVCLGDSITFGWGVDGNSLFTEMLEGYFTNVEVINMGVPGYGIDQELLFLEQEGVKYHPDLVLIYVIPHDLERACYSKIWGRPKPQFSLNNNQLMLSNVPVPRGNIFHYLWNQSKLKVIGNEAITEQIARAIFKEMYRVTNIINAKLVIVGDLSGNMEKFFKENNIYFCENPLLTYKGNPKNLYYIEFHHPNVLGHRLITEGIYNYLVQNRLVPQGYLVLKK